MSMHRGYIKLWRKIEDDGFWKEKRIFSKAEAWIDIIKESNFKMNIIIIDMESFKCDRGECMRSTRSWGNRWGWSEYKVRMFFKLLAKLDKILLLKTTPKTTHLRVCKYDIYQDDQRGDNAQTTTNNNDKNKDIKEKDIYRSFAHLSLSLKEFGKLLKDGYSEPIINEYLDSLENYKKNKNYTSANLTIRKWMKKDGVKPKGVHITPKVSL